MERKVLSVSESESELISGIPVPPNDAGKASFYEGFALRGIHVDQIHPGSLSCTFKVPPRLTDSTGNLSPGAIANLVDEVGWAAIYADTMVSMKVSVDMSISYLSLSSAKLHDELEITAKVLGHKGGYSGSSVLLRNKATGEVVAAGRHSLFGISSTSQLFSCPLFDGSIGSLYQYGP